ncbi:MAG: restriction endonuclease subunit S [Deltaproteobacteria bacterium]|nr:restriction endonuclease subunit S [Deltaproteobacteria bacterium]
MTSKYQAYPGYRNSGVEWIGSMPNGWCDSRIKFFSQLNPPKQEARCLPPDTEVTFLPMEAIGEKGELDTSVYKKIGDLINGYTYLGENDVLIAKITPCFENGKGALVRGLKNGVAFATTEVIPLRVTAPNNSKFLYYLLSCDPFRKIAEGTMYGAGGQKRVSDGFVANYHFAKPSNAECETIANFLDHETAKIDTLIDKQQQLIKLLKEKRQAVISHAVTKGLNPDAPMKDSGVEWLGEVPEHWDVRTVSKLSNKITNGYVGPTRDILVDEGVPYVQATHIKKGKVNFDGAYFVREHWSDEHSKSILSKDDVLIVQTGAGTGDMGLVSEEEVGFNCHALIIVEPDKKVISGGFLLMVFQSEYGYSKLYSIRTGGMHPHLNCGEVQFVKVPIPSRVEQDQITNYIEEKITRFDLLVSKQLDTISLMQERRTALISAAVTGKIDVRNWRAQKTEPCKETSA